MRIANRGHFQLITLSLMPNTPDYAMTLAPLQFRFYVMTPRLFLISYFLHCSAFDSYQKLTLCRFPIDTPPFRFNAGASRMLR